MQGARHALLPDGKRLHLQHGPIDIIAGAEGAPGEVGAAYAQAAAFFESVLGDLADELARLRAPVTQECTLAGGVARRMWRAAAPHGAGVTPMIAVAGAVADAVLAAMVAGRTLARAHVNNGGDIALHLPEGAAPYRAAVAVDPAAPQLAGTVEVAPAMPVRGIATSGAPGRSFSLGIADSVTVLARSAAEADAAATLIANAVDLPDHPAIRRARACDLDPDSDLGERPVTVAVGALAAQQIDAALAAGAARATRLRRSGAIAAAFLALQGRTRIVGAAPPAPEQLEPVSRKGLAECHPLSCASRRSPSRRSTMKAASPQPNRCTGSPVSA